MKFRKLRFAAGIAAVAAVLAMAAPASSLPRYTEAFDCDTDGEGWYNHALAAGTTVTVALTSCSDLPMHIESGSVVLNGIPVTDSEFSVPGDRSRITVTPGTEIYSLWFDMEFPLAEEMTDPSGALLGTESVTFGRMPSQFSVGTQKQIDRGMDVDLDRRGVCSLEAGDHVFKTSTLTVDTKGKYAIRVVETDPVSLDLTFRTDFHPFDDLFLAVYPDHERPWNIGSKKLSGCNDDANDWVTADAHGWIGAYTTESGTVFNWRNPWAKLNLKPGKYTLVWSTYDTNNTFDWSRGMTADGYSFDSGKSTLTYEVWGPSGALVG